ncbi:hypothetical protein BV22DRAFT_1028193 [Leucogyrophana mollusca]|uniref:Uncharacterized protein n=1 Tax=Leucogyrophana mollusca TaxID=85980 RepID=A0ACB8BXS2_9AGAM|nr:hypothetical protein BV22DRAFT_1028193 [Leucogyrophana mollusca]
MPKLYEIRLHAARRVMSGCRWMLEDARSTATHLNDPQSGRRPPVTLWLTRSVPEFRQGLQVILLL